MCLNSKRWRVRSGMVLAFKWFVGHDHRLNSWYRGDTIPTDGLSQPLSDLSNDGYDGYHADRESISSEPRGYAIECAVVIAGKVQSDGEQIRGTEQYVIGVTRAGSQVDLPALFAHYPNLMDLRETA